MVKTSTIYQDYVVSYLRAQLTVLQQLLQNIEAFNYDESDYMVESLRRIEGDVRRLRKFLQN